MISNRRGAANSNGSTGGYTKANPKSSAPVASPYNGGNRKSLSEMKGHSKDEGSPDLLKWFLITFLGTLALLSFGGSSSPKTTAGVATVGETNVNLRGTEPPALPVVPAEPAKEQPVPAEPAIEQPLKELTAADWDTSKAKLLLQRDIETSEEKRALKPIILQNTRKEYRQFGLEVFRQHMQEEIAAFDKLYNPAPDPVPKVKATDPPAAQKLTESDWAGSKAEELLKSDVEIEEKRQQKPIILQETRPEYGAFGFEVFRSHLLAAIEAYDEAHKPTEPPAPKLKEEDWANSRAQELLKRDILHFEEKRNEKPILLQETRKEYRAFAFEVFRHHFHEEVEAYNKANPTAAAPKKAKDETPVWQYLAKRDVVDAKKSNMEVADLKKTRPDYKSVEITDFKKFVVKTKEEDKSWLTLLKDDLKKQENIDMKPIKLQQTRKEYEAVEFEVFRTALAAEKLSRGIEVDNTVDDHPVWWGVLRNDLKDPEKLKMNPKQLQATRPKYQQVPLAEFRDAFFAEKLALLNKTDKKEEAENPAAKTESAGSDPTPEKSTPKWMKLLKEDLKSDVKSQMKPIKLQETRPEYKEVKFEEFRTTLAAQKLAVNEAKTNTAATESDAEDDESVPHWLMTLRKDLTDPEKRKIKPKELKKTRDLYAEVDLELFRHCVWSLKEKVH